MKLATIKHKGLEQVSIIIPTGAVKIETINRKLNKKWLTDLFGIIQTGQISEIKEWYNTFGREFLLNLNDGIISLDKIEYAPLYRNPGKIWGIGLNYREHADELSEKTPSGYPGSFMKPATTIIGNGENIKIPKISKKTTGEGELGIIIGRKCKDVSVENWLDVVAGFTTIIDMTAEDILRKNVRYLTMSKSFDTFFSFGPQLLTIDEIENVDELEVATVKNDKIYVKNKIKNMTFKPHFLVSFHSQIMTLLPGDVISTGTPGAVQLNRGDIIECRINGFENLRNPVV